MPTPDDSASWEDIAEFKSDLYEKQWNFRNFLNDLATKKLTPAEIKDKIHWSLNEYREGMKRRNIKIVNGAITAIVVPAADFAFNTSGNHLGSILAAGIAINKIRTDLLESEMKAPGRECAYIFDAEKRFGREIAAHAT